MLNFDENLLCKKCLLPEPFASLNKNRICHACLSYQPLVLKGMSSLHKIIEKKRGEGKYDCMVCISGGRDSTYSLYVAKKLLNLRVLAFNYNNEFVHEQATANMEMTCNKLGIDFVSVVSRRKICHKIIADQVRMAARFGPSYLEDHLCGPCNVSGFLAGKRIAMQEKIPIVILGNSDAEKLPNYLKLAKHIPLRKKIANKKVGYFFRSHFYRLLQRIEFSPTFREIMNFRFRSGNEDPESQTTNDVLVLPIFNYIKWDRREIVSTIEKELGWKKPDNKASSWRFDCRLLDLVNYLWFKECGFPKFFFGYVQMIRNGTMNKNEALKQLTAKNWGEFTHEMEDLLLNEIGIEQKYIDVIKSY